MKIAMMMAAAGIATTAAAQTDLFAEDFEGADQFSTSVLQFSDGGGDFWFETGGAFSTGGFVEYFGADGNFFNGMDLDGEGAGLPLIQTFDTFNIGGFTGLEFSIDLAEDDSSDGSEDFDDIDFVAFEYSLDGGSFVEFARVGSIDVNVPFNSAPAFNGVEVTNEFATFSVDLAGVVGSTLAVRAVWNLNSGDEDLAIDNVTVTGIPAPASAALLGLGGLAAARRRR
ncbi:MAG: hypothetical protein AAGF47_02380 [Planctomycetota bacterium]